jgi:hypothetical protein
LGATNFLNNLNIGSNIHTIRYTYSARIGENARVTLAFSPILSLIRISILCQVNALLLSMVYIFYALVNRQLQNLKKTKTRS